MHRILIDEEIYKHLAAHVTDAFADDPNRVLRRLLGLPDTGPSGRGFARPGQLKPLIDAGLLACGQTVTWTQPRLRHTHTATVTADGHLALPDGTTWYSPHQATKQLTGYPADGWKAFTDDHGRTLAELAAAVPAETE